MPKKEVTKVKICISLDKDIYHDIKKHCDSNLIKVSTYIDYLIKKAHKPKEGR